MVQLAMLVRSTIIIKGHLCIFGKVDSSLAILAVHWFAKMRVRPGKNDTTTAGSNTANRNSRNQKRISFQGKACLRQGCTRSQNKVYLQHNRSPDPPRIQAAECGISLIRSALTGKHFQGKEHWRRSEGNG